MDAILHFITVREEGNKEEFRSSLENICSETDDIYIDSVLTEKYFKILHQQLFQTPPDNVEDIAIIYKALLASCKTTHGIYLLKQSQLCIELYSRLPTEVNIIEWPCENTTRYALLFQILKFISRGHCFNPGDPILYTILERLTSVFLLQDKAPEISSYALECMLNLCCANVELLGPQHLKALQIDATLKILLVLGPPEKNLKSANPFTNSMIPTMVVHLLLILEPMIGDLPEYKVMVLLNDTLQALPSTILKKNYDLTCRIAEFLRDLLSKPSKHSILQNYGEFNSSLENILNILNDDSIALNSEARLAVLTLLPHLMSFIPFDQISMYPLDFGMKALEHFVWDYKNNANIDKCNASIAKQAIEVCRRSIVMMQQAPANMTFNKVSNFGRILVKLCSHLADNDLNITRVNETEVVSYISSLFRAMNYLIEEYDNNFDINKSIIQDLNTISEKCQNCIVDLAYLQVIKTLKQCNTFEKELKVLFNTPQPSLCQRLTVVLKNGEPEQIFETYELMRDLPPILDGVNNILQNARSLHKADNVYPVPYISQAYQHLLDSCLPHLQAGITEDPKDNLSMMQLAKLKIQSLMSEIETYKNSLEAANKLNMDISNTVHNQNKEYTLLLDKLMQKESMLQLMSAKLRDVTMESDKFELKVKEMNKELVKEHDNRLQCERATQLVRRELAEEKERFAALTMQYGQLTEQLKHRLEQSKGLEEKLAIYEKEATALVHAKKKLEKQCESKDATIKTLQSEKEALSEEIKQLHQIQNMVTQLMNRTQDKKK